MWGAARAIPDLFIAFPWSGTIAVGMVVVGVGIAAVGVISFRRAGTSVNPLQPAKVSTLVVTGVYRMSRNPMYLGMLLCLLGWAVFLSNLIAFLFLPPFVMFMNRWQIRPEEEALASRFGPEFAAYKNRTRRWL